MLRKVVVCLVFVAIYPCYCQELEEMVLVNRNGTKSVLCTNEKPCIRKCCLYVSIVVMQDEGANSSSCVLKKNANTIKLPRLPNLEVYTTDRVLTKKNITSAFRLLKGYKKILRKSEAFIVYEPFLLIEDGSLRIQQPYRYPNWKEYDSDSFCIDHVKHHDGKVGVRAFVLKSQWKSNKRSNVVTIVTMLISSAFLIVTLSVYSMQPKLRNLHGKVLMAYAASFLGFFLTQSIYQLVYEVHKSITILCHILALPAYYSLLATFFWTNIMSFDIWWKFRGTTQSIQNGRGQKRKYFLYCLYGFGSPLIITVAFAVINYLPQEYVDRSIVTPGITSKDCFLGAYERLFYIYYPMATLITANFLLFVATSFNIYILKRDSKNLRATGNKREKQRRRDIEQFLMYLKIFSLMGVSWLLEIVSSVNPLMTFWYITDVYNSLIGLFIFLIFVCKKQVLRVVLNRKLSTSYAQTTSKANASTDRATDTSDHESVQKNVSHNK